MNRKGRKVNHLRIPFWAFVSVFFAAFAVHFASFAVMLLPCPAHDLTREIIGAAIKIHRKLGPGLLESAYEACLAYELRKLGHES